VGAAWETYRMTAYEPKGRAAARQRPGGVGPDFGPRSIARPGETFGERYPVLAERAVCCPKYPRLDVRRVKVGSNLWVEWRCVCGATFGRKVRDITNKQAALCGKCGPAGKSCLEFEVAGLLRVIWTRRSTHTTARRARMRSTCTCRRPTSLSNQIRAGRTGTGRRATAGASLSTLPRMGARFASAKPACRDRRLPDRACRRAGAGVGTRYL
jgi:hypothetical protein